MEPWTPADEFPPGEADARDAGATNEIIPVTTSRPASLRPDSWIAYQRRSEAERDALADERDRLADERENLADDREALADDRERLADDREREADDRERSLDELARRVGARVLSLEERTLEHLSRSRSVLAAQARRLDRQEAQITRARALRTQEQHATITALAADEWAQPDADPDDPVQQAAMLTELARASLAAFARTAEEAARRHDQAAASGTRRCDDHRRTAERAREAVRKSAEIMREFPGETPAESS